MMDRITLAIAACQGMTDADLAQRGPAGFAKMIDRKRKYAHFARTLATAVPSLKQQVDDLKHQLALAKSQIAALQELEAPVTDTKDAQAVLANITKK